MPQSFYGVELNEEMPDMWLPITMQQVVMQQQQGSLLDAGGMYWLHMIARRNAGVSAARAQAWTTTQLQQFMTSREGTQLPERRRQEIAASFVPLVPIGAGISHLRADYEAPLAVLMGVVVLVLLIACANLANFLLAKAASREREFTTRLALGSSRTRIVRQVLTETMLLAFSGGALGLLLAFLGTRGLINFVVGKEAHTALSAIPDLHVLGFTSVICLLTGILFTIAPAMHVSRMSASGALNATARTAGSGGGRSARLLPKALVVGQVMFSLVLLAVAGLFVRTLHNLRSQDLGFNRTNLLLVNTNPRFAGYKPQQLNGLYERILTRVQALPGVRSAALSGQLPIARGNWGSPITILGRPITPNEDVSTYLNRVSAGYFETLGIPLLRGRTINADDTATSLKAVVVNQTLATLYFPHGDAIGHSFTVADPGVKGTWQIVGIVRDSRFRASATKPEPMAYLPVTQLTEDDQYAYWLQVQSAGDPAKSDRAGAGCVCGDRWQPTSASNEDDQRTDRGADRHAEAGLAALDLLCAAGVGTFVPWALWSDDLQRGAADERDRRAHCVGCAGTRCPVDGATGVACAAWHWDRGGCAGYAGGVPGGTGGTVRGRSVGCDDADGGGGS